MFNQQKNCWRAFMLRFSENRNIYIYGNRVDMRMGLNKIQILVALNFTRIEIVKSIFIFCSRDSKQVKIYYEDEYGAWLLQNRLFDTTFKLPKQLESGVQLSKKQLEMFLKGLDVIERIPTRALEQKDYF